MTENQKKLISYVEARVDEIIDHKYKSNIAPLIASEPEIVSEIRNDVIECMRELHRQCKYYATNTLNAPALIKIENND